MSDIFNNIQIPYTSTQTGNAAVSELQKKESAVVKDSISASPCNNNVDSIEIKTEQQKQKKNPIKSLKTFIANIKKFFASAGEYIKGGAKGIAAGSVAGSLIYTAGSILNHFKSKSAEKAGTVAKKTPNKALAIAAAGIAVAASLWNASLNATERNSNIDLRWQGLNNNNK